jgi:hypothetical protein
VGVMMRTVSTHHCRDVEGCGRAVSKTVMTSGP